MIASFRDKWLRAFFVQGESIRNIPPDIARRVFRALQMIDDAMTDQDLRVPPSNQFEALLGSPEGWHSIRVSRRWRLVFRWKGNRGEAESVYLEDHSYR